MKARDFNFINEYIIGEENLKLFRSFVLDKKSRSKQPNKFTKNLPNVPKFLSKGSRSEITIWVLINYEGSHYNIIMYNDTDRYEVDDSVQRAIKISMSNVCGVSWELFQTNADDIRFIDINCGIRTFKK